MSGTVRKFWARKQHHPESRRKLVRDYGFTKLNVSDPLRAPVGAVVVYAGDNGGHVGLRTADDFISDFASATPYGAPLLGA